MRGLEGLGYGEEPGEEALQVCGSKGPRRKETELRARGRALLFITSFLLDPGARGTGRGRTGTSNNMNDNRRIW